MGDAGPSNTKAPTALEAAAAPGLEHLRETEQLLEVNKGLISKLNANHEQRTPEGLAENLSLIRELNANLSKVKTLYGKLSAAVTSIDADIKSES